MTPGDALLIFAAGLAAGTVNTVVGSGSLITFPTLLAVGYPAVVANVSNNVGLVPGSLSGAVGYRRELAGQRDRIVKLGAASIAGGLTGAILLLALPGSVFKKVVPALILLACLLVAVQPWLSRLLAHRRQHRGRRRRPVDHRVSDRGLRRLLRRGAGRHPHRPPGHLHRRGPAAPQRGEERPRRAGQRHRRGRVHPGRPRGLGSRRA